MAEIVDNGIAIATVIKIYFFSRFLISLRTFRFKAGKRKHNKGLLQQINITINSLPPVQSFCRQLYKFTSLPTAAPALSATFQVILVF